MIVLICVWLPVGSSTHLPPAVSMTPTKIVEIELSRPLEPLTNLDHYSHIRGLVRLYGNPIGEIDLPVVQGSCSVSAIAQAILPHYNWAIARDRVQQRLSQDTGSWQIQDLLDLPPARSAALPSVTVVVCVRSGTDPTRCLEALQRLDQPPLEVLVVEANPQNDALQLQLHDYPTFQYGCTPQSGLNAARNWAIAQAKGEIIAFTEASCVVDANWIEQIATTFTDHADLMAMTGLVLPAELKTEAQSQFDRRYGLGRGTERIWYQLDPGQPIYWPSLGTMQVGSGVNMAYRRQVFEQIGGFDPALDRPDLTWGGGDWEMFCRVLLSGHQLLYEPSALVRYIAPCQTEMLRSQVTQDMIAFYAYLAAGLQRYPDQWLNFLGLGLWKLAQLIKSYLKSDGSSRSLILAELQGVWQSWGRYGTARRSEPVDSLPAQPVRATPPDPAKMMAVRSIDLAKPLYDLTDIADYRAVRVFVNLGHHALGFVDIEHKYRVLSAARLRQEIATQLYLELLAIPHQGDTGAAWTALQTAFVQRWMPATVPSPSTQPPQTLPNHIPVSIIITTCDRPDDLVDCLRHLQAQETSRPVEIIVADNRPASGLTPPVVAQFPAVKLVQEARPGASYGRNAAIAASTGEIVASVDDDVVVPPDWLEKLIAPFARPEVMVVTGNVLPLELETPAQLLFETLKGGLGQGFKPFEVDHNWLNSFTCSPPIWNLGVSANAAFRATIFSHPQIGLMDEVLGPGTPTVGGGEENHLVYKVLRAGYTLVYEPAAFVWHRHRRDLKSLYRQIYGHMVGGTAYHLLLWLQEKDQRGLRQLMYELPRYYIRHIIDRLKGRHQTPWPLLWSEVKGYFVAYWGYWKSRQLVQQQGRSAPYIPVAERQKSIRVGPIVSPNLQSSFQGVQPNLLTSHTNEE